MEKYGSPPDHANSEKNKSLSRGHMFIEERR